MKMKGHVLLVDDEQIVRDSLAEWLETEGLNVTTAENGMVALEKVENTPPDVAIVDIKMPGMDGVTLLKKVKEKGYQFPVIMMTAFATIENAVQSMKDGAYDFVSKPCPPEKLSNMIFHILEHEQLKKEHIKLKSERRHILHIAISAFISFIVLGLLLYFIFGN
jgi:DNA-binding NtrC family response regulator